VFTCTVEIDTGLSGSQDIEYYCGGDEYGSPPHEFSGTCIVDPALDHDLTGVSVTGNVIPSEGIESIYQITVYNQGNNPADTYTVELYLEGDILIGSVTGTTIDPGETLIYDIPWTPSSPGVTYLYGYINYAEDENTNNNTTPNFDVNVQSAGGFPISIGNGTDLSYQIPANFYYKSSLSQCWYYPEEINFGGNIMQIGYQTNWATDLQDMPMRIWMVATTQSQASIGWIPAGDMTLVFDGTIDLPPGYNHILFHLDTYFGYSCANNLVIMVQRPMDTQYYSYCDTWFCTFDISHPARTVHYYSDYVEMDPYAPSGGNIINYLPNLYLYFTGPQTRSLEGYVYENLIQGRDVIEGAYVEIEETTFGGTHTDDSGYYIFPGVFIENYNVTASAFGYYDETINVTIAEYGPNQQDFHLVRLPNVEVSGHVITSDTGEDVVGALVELEGYD
ncbi:MAG: carboxypeptidase regulatory-like domain-containing protein, partial [Candidatus Cloacimonetes bacterium]|nr:carboxypeptidase regulatory-like domain-containing protein [Candidatus Cloacimonadota bacterium]